MKGVGGAGFIIIGFLFLYLAITGKMDCFFTFVGCLFGTTDDKQLASVSTTGGNIVAGIKDAVSTNVPAIINFATR